MEKHATRRTTLKLHLKKERIRNLVSSELAQAHGGAQCLLSCMWPDVLSVTQGGGGGGGGGGGNDTNYHC